MALWNPPGADGSIQSREGILEFIEEGRDCVSNFTGRCSPAVANVDAGMFERRFPTECTNKRWVGYIEAA
ncbi:MAG: hypothetical protein RQ751_07250 [Longimicrobiales bacterium]|nr:hypothetical protein [Longimicrobiales bacterium]